MSGKKGNKIENLMNKTIELYNQKENSYWFKSYPKTIVKYFSKTNFCIKYISKGNCDYYGIYQGKYITIEAKQTINNSKYNINNILEHQQKILEVVEKLQGESYLIFLFEHYQVIKLVSWWQFKQLLETTTKKYLFIKDILSTGEHVLIKNNYLELLSAMNKITNQSGQSDWLH